jgi:hypothetical protein
VSVLFVRYFFLIKNDDNNDNLDPFQKLRICDIRNDEYFLRYFLVVVVFIVVSDRMDSGADDDDDADDNNTNDLGDTNVFVSNKLIG